MQIFLKLGCVVSPRTRHSGETIVCDEPIHLSGEGEVERERERERQIGVSDTDIGWDSRQGEEKRKPACAESRHQFTAAWKVDSASRVW